jgi:hypothetical protein
MLCQLSYSPTRCCPSRCTPDSVPRPCAVRHLSRAAGAVLRRRAVRITPRGVTALGTPTATGPNLWLERSEERSPTSPAHPPCSRLDIRLAAAVAGSAGGLLHHLFHPSPSRAGSVCCCSCRRSTGPCPAAPVLAVSHGNHVCGSREVPLVTQWPRAAEPLLFQRLYFSCEVRVWQVSQ